MKRSRYLIMLLVAMVGISVFSSPVFASKYFTETSNPMSLVDSYYDNQKKGTDTVQDTDLDRVTSKCKEFSAGEKFTISHTLCNIKENITDYLQYIMYIGLTMATILLIRNGFQIVTASNKEDQMKKFTKNLIYIIIGVVLLTGFYYIIDIFVSVVNLVENA